MLSAIPPLLHPDGHTLVLTTQNGVEAHDRVAERCGKACVLAAVTRVAAYIERPGVVVKTEAFTGGSLEIGECFPETANTGRVASLLELFAVAGITASSSEDILAALWTKLVSMGSFGPVGAAARAPIDVLIALQARQLARRVALDINSWARSVRWAIAAIRPCRAQSSVHLADAVAVEWSGIGDYAVGLFPAPSGGGGHSGNCSVAVAWILLYETPLSGLVARVVL